MNNRHFRAANTTGFIDFLFGMVIFFFMIISVLPINQECLTIDPSISKSEDKNKNPVHLQMLISSDNPVPAFKVVDSGGHGLPGNNQSVRAWLGSLCGPTKNTVEVSINCPGVTSHADCKKGLAYLMERATCKYKY